MVMDERENLFYEILNYLQQLKNFEDEFEDLFNHTNIGLKFERRTFVDIKLVDYLIRTLEVMFLDSERWINYWVYDLDFGRGWKPGTVVESNGNDIKIETKEELYNFLNKKLIYKSERALEKIDREKAEAEYLNAFQG